MTPKEIKDLVSKNRLSEALTALETALPQSLQQQALEFQRQLTDSESKSRIGLLSYSEENARRAKLA